MNRPRFADTLKPRPVPEVLGELIFRPLAYLVVLLVWPIRVTPEVILAAQVLLGLVAAALVWMGEGLPAALVLQFKTVLDNADGQLARARSRTGELARYLDTEGDLLVNAALFAALGAWVHNGWLALVAFTTFTLLLSWDFSLERLFRASRGEVSCGSAVQPGRGALFRLARGFYITFFVAQERGIEALERGLLARFGHGGVPPGFWWDEHALASVVNLGLSTQLLFMGLFLALGLPEAYLWLVLLEGVYLVGVYIWRIQRIRGWAQRRR